MTATTVPADRPTPAASGLRTWAPWIAMAAIIVVALAFGTFAQPTPTKAERAQSIASTIRCPSCRSQSAASSDTPSSQAVRALIKEQIAAGKTDEEIRDYVNSRYPGQNLLLDPAGSGFGGLVWALPVIMVVVALAGLVIRFRGYGSTRKHATAADRALVDQALHAPPATPEEPES